MASALAGAAIACSSSSGSDGSSGSSGALDSGASDSATADAGGDAGAVVINACTMFVDRSAAGASRTITWDFAVSTAPERCMTIKVGQKVTWAGVFATHPLLAGDGDKPNPVATVDQATGEGTFPKAGVYGFICGNHPSMIGAIKVIE